METEGTRQRKKTRWDCVRADMKSFGLSCEDAQDRDQWRLRIKGEPANPGLPGKRPRVTTKDQAAAMPRLSSEQMNQIKKMKFDR